MMTLPGVISINQRPHLFRLGFQARAAATAGFHAAAATVEIFPEERPD